MILDHYYKMHFSVARIYVDILKDKYRIVSITPNRDRNEYELTSRAPYYTLSFTAGITISDLDHYSAATYKYYLGPNEV